jgi:hypothetical protein
LVDGGHFDPASAIPPQRDFYNDPSNPPLIHINPVRRVIIPKPGGQAMSATLGRKN